MRIEINQEEVAMRINAKGNRYSFITVVSACFFLCAFVFHVPLYAAGEIVAWGDNSNGECDVPSPNTGFMAVAAGQFGDIGWYSLGLKSDVSIVAWGWDSSNVPSPNSGFVAIAAGTDYALGLKTDGSIVAWGYNGDGRCDVPEPNTGFTAIAAGNNHSLGLKQDGSIVAWGDNWAGECDVPEPNTGFTAIAAGYYHSLGLKQDGSIVAWGNNEAGECDVPEPNTGFMAIAAGGWHSLGLKQDGSIVAWGDNWAGECDVPEPNTGFMAIAAGVGVSLGLKTDGSIVAWGYNDYGQCDVPEPNTGFTAIATSGYHSLGLRIQMEMVEVPDVTWMTQADAESAIITSGLIVGSITYAYSNDVDAELVISQSIPAGTMVATGSAIDIVISLGHNVADLDYDGLVNLDDLEILASEWLKVREQGVYGTKGVADANNVPGGSDSGVSWIDTSDNLWLFGGEGLDSTGNWGLFNYLWKFDGSNWTWVSGSNTAYQSGVYGTKGVADANNVPGARAASVSWIDNSGNLWLFGGWVYDSNSDDDYLFNDLWKFNSSSGLWTWVSGSKAANKNGVYGAKGVADVNNAPGGRSWSISWIDNSGNLWLFGGGGFDSVRNWQGLLSDLWKFDGSNWTWVSGSNLSSQNGVYGTKGVSDANNVPGAREGSLSWTDDSGNFWLFGGNGYVASGYGGVLNDLWKYNPTNGFWTWVSGSDGENQRGNYGTKGVADANNVPGARYFGVSWTDASGNFWLFGGNGYDSTGNWGTFNDLWKFDGSNWTWVSGSNTAYQYGVYGTKGVADANNVPGARYGFISWTDASGNFWLFGGSGYDSTGNWWVFNDLWKFDGSNWTWVSGSSNIWVELESDMNGDGVVNFFDYAIFAQHWLEGVE
ncbi:MAG: PASTA domain-containing protein [Sedimentisphaerales bacterium]